MLTENIKTIQTDDSPFDDEFQARFFIGLEKMKKMRGYQTQEASRANVFQWKTDSLPQLARKFELVEELLSLEQDCLFVRQQLEGYRNGLKNAIQNRLAIQP